MAIEARRSPFEVISKIGTSIDNSQDTRLQKSLLVIGSFMFISTGLLWGIVYIFFQELLPGVIPLSYGIVSFLSIVYFGLTRKYRFFRASQLVLILVLPFLMLALGGYVNSSAVILWSFICPLGALLFAEYKSLIEKYDVEKIRTIGDNYVIASGLPRPRADHAQALAYLALEMNAYVASLAPVGERRLSFRIGINSGPVIAGVIGYKNSLTTFGAIR